MRGKRFKPTLIFSHLFGILPIPPSSKHTINISIEDTTNTVLVELHKKYIKILNFFYKKKVKVKKNKTQFEDGYKMWWEGGGGGGGMARANLTK